MSTTPLPPAGPPLPVPALGTSVPSGAPPTVARVEVPVETLLPAALARLIVEAGSGRTAPPVQTALAALARLEGWLAAAPRPTPSREVARELGALLTPYDPGTPAPDSPMAGPSAPVLARLAQLVLSAALRQRLGSTVAPGTAVPTAETAEATLRTALLEHETAVKVREGELARERVASGVQVVEVPVRFGEHVVPVRISVRDDEGRARQAGEADAEVALCVDLPSTGPIEAVLQWRTGRLAVAIFAAQETTASRLRACLPDLAARLRERGYAAPDVMVWLNPARLMARADTRAAGGRLVSVRG